MPGFDIWEDSKVLEAKYPELASWLYGVGGEQKMIPFLGAGVSVSARTDDDPTSPITGLDQDKVQQIIDLLGLKGPRAKLFLEYALRVVVRMETWENSGVDKGWFLSRGEIETRLANCDYPPFAWELSELFSLAAAYSAFEDYVLSKMKKDELLPTALLT